MYDRVSIIIFVIDSVFLLIKNDKHTPFLWGSLFPQHFALQGPPKISPIYPTYLFEAVNTIWVGLAPMYCSSAAVIYDLSQLCKQE